MVREVRQRAHRRQYPESSHRLRPVSRTRRPRHAPTQHHTQRRKRMEGSDRRHQQITLSTKRTAGTIHRLPAVPLIGDPITKNSFFSRKSQDILHKAFGGASQNPQLAGQASGFSVDAVVPARASCLKPCTGWVRCSRR